MINRTEKRKEYTELLRKYERELQLKLRANGNTEKTTRDKA